MLWAEERKPTPDKGIPRSPLLLVIEQYDLSGLEVGSERFMEIKRAMNDIEIATRSRFSRLLVGEEESHYVVTSFHSSAGMMKVDLACCSCICCGNLEFVMLAVFIPLVVPVLALVA